MLKSKGFKSLIGSVLFILMLWSLVASAAAAPIVVGDEIKKTESNLRALNLKKNSLDQRYYDREFSVLTKYLDALYFARDENPVASSALVRNGKSAVQISERFQNWLLGAILNLDVLQKADVPVYWIYALFDYVEAHKIDWQLGDLPQDFQIKDKYGRPHAIKFGLDSRGRIYLVFEDSILGTGTNKEAVRVTQYWDWVSVSRLTPINSADPKEKKVFEREKRFLKKISDLPLENQVGLVRVLHIDDNIYEDLYDTELFNVVADITPLHLDYIEWLELAVRITKGLVQLHKMGICLSDIKPENILLKFSQSAGQPIEIVLTDLGLAFEPMVRLSLDKDRPSRGSPHYAAPEVVLGSTGGDQGWYGRNLYEKAENAFKGDVFSLGVVLYSMTHMNDPKARHVPWMQCSEAQGWSYFFRCREKMLATYLRNVELQKSEGQSFSPNVLMDEILAKTFEADPVKRISSEELLHELTSLIRRLKAPEQLEIEVVAEVSDVSSEDLHSRPGCLQKVWNWLSETCDKAVRSCRKPTRITGDPLVQMYQGKLRHQPSHPKYDPLQKAY